VTSELSEITEKALKLPQGEQLRLVRTLLDRNEASGDSGVDAAWDQEIERRIQMIDDGLAKGRPFADVVRDTDCSRRGEQEFAESIVYYESKERDWGRGFGMKSWMPWTESYAIPSCPG
jgi:putative addiction module component (TIGR02574 family)